MSYHGDIRKLLENVPPECLLRGAKDIHNALTDIMNRHANITVAFEGSEELYTTIILKSDRENRFFVIDGLKPDSGHQRAVALQPFTFRSNVQGVDILATGNVISGKGQHAGNAIYKVPYPETLVHMQRRNAYRVFLRRGMGGHAIMKALGRSEPLRGEVLDLSASGMKVRVPEMLDPPASDNEKFHEVFVEVPGRGDFTCRAILRHANFVRQQQVTMCGMQFDELDGRTSQRIAMLVNEIDRETRREKMRLETDRS